jgi:hypothetical protein
MLRRGDFKLIANLANSSWYGDTEETYLVDCIGGADVTQLFDIASDPTERHDLASQPAYAPVLAELRSLAAKLFEEQFFVPPKPFGGWYDSTDTRIVRAFQTAGDYVVPWGCEVM